MTKLPDPGDALRIAAFLHSHPGWSAFWDKHDGVWRVAEDDPSWSQLHRTLLVSQKQGHWVQVNGS
jgi:hypothetical protein